MRHLARSALLAAALLAVGAPALAEETPGPAPRPGRVSEQLAGERQATESQDWYLQIFGPAMWPLWLCSIVLVALVFERHKALRRRNIMDPQMVERVAERAAERDLAAAQEEAARSSTALGRAWAQALHECRLGGVALAEALTNATVLAFKPLKRNLRVISTIAVISPLLGLLGTVLGMIMTFSQIAATGGAEKTKLADGIAVALFTTAAGLIIAIPAIIAGRYYSARIVAYADEAEADIDRLNYRYTHARAQESTEAQAPEPAQPEPQGVPAAEE